jgi:hypothetical protein
MTIRLLLAALLLLAPVGARAQQTTIYDLSAALNFGFGVLNQILDLQRRIEQNDHDYGYGAPYGYPGHGRIGHPGWYPYGQPWPAPLPRRSTCPPQILYDPMGNPVLVDPCTGQILR